MSRIKALRSWGILRLSVLYRKNIFILFFISFFSSAFLLFGPYLSKLFIDNSFLNKDLNAFIKFSVIGAAIFLFSTIFGIIENIVKNRINVKIKLKLAEKFIRKYYSLDLKAIQSKSSGENIYRIANIEMLSRFIVWDLPRILVDIVKLPIILGISFFVSVRVTVCLVVLSPLFLLRSFYIRRKLRPIHEEIWRSGAKMAKRIHESFSRILIIKAFGLEVYEARSYVRLLINYIRKSIESFRWSIASSVSSTFLSKAVYGGISLYGGWLIIKGKLSLGSYTAVMLYLTQLGNLLLSISNNLEYFIQESVTIDKFFEVIDYQPRIIDYPAARAVKRLDGKISFKNVYFGYEEGRPVIKGINLEIPAGLWVGIVGPSGCGKTTFVNLILRLYEIWNGEILLDNLDLRTITLDSLKDRIAIATQEPLLFDLSIKESIVYGLSRIAQEQIEEVAKTVQIDDFISGLPDGYDTLIGENACFLSQGCKQRIALARAVIRNPDILILDEAMSSMDSIIENKILEGLRTTRAGRSTIIISHRLSSIKDADRIYFFGPDGHIEYGTHRELMARNNLYIKFFQNQIETNAR